MVYLVYEKKHEQFLLDSVKAFESLEEAETYIQNFYKSQAEIIADGNFQTQSLNFEAWIEENLEFDQEYPNSGNTVNKFLPFIYWENGHVKVTGMHESIFHWFAPERVFGIKYIEFSVNEF